jgi:poly(A) polymerase
MPPATDRRRDFAAEVVARLQAAGFQALWAGGCVRDLLLGLTPTDYDVATNATPEQVMGLFRRTVPVGVSFGVVKVLGPKQAGEVEVATFRSDGAYIDGRRPEGVVFGSAEVDASRRDFTINGMFLDPLTHQVIDYVNGRVDLQNRTLRAIGDAAARFQEDKLRLLRAVRFAARFGMDIEPATLSALVAMADQVVVVAVERITQELRKMLVDRHRARAFDLALETGLLAKILPPLARLKGIPGDGLGHPPPDLWEHTLLILDHLPEEPSVPLAFAALLHHVGRGAAGVGLDRALGNQIVDKLGRSLRLSNPERERTCWLVEHQRALVVPDTMRASQLKRLLASTGIEELLALHRAEALATTGDDGHVSYCEWYLREEPAGPINPPPLLSGHDLQQLGLKPGPRFKQLLDLARDAQLDGMIADRDEAVALVLRWIASGNAIAHD